MKAIPPLELEIHEKIVGERKNIRKVRLTSDLIRIGTSAEHDIDLRLIHQAFSVELRYENSRWILLNKSRSSSIRSKGKSVWPEIEILNGSEIYLDQHLMKCTSAFKKPAEKSFHFSPRPRTDEALWQHLIEEAEFDEVMINGLGPIIVDYQGSLLTSPWHFESEEFLTQKVVEATGKFHHWSSWRINRFLRVQAALSPLVSAPHICIRKGRPHVFSIDELAAREFGSPEQIDFLKDCIQKKESILISGATSTGKTVLMRSLVEQIPSNERLIILEEEAETTWPHPHSVLVETGRGGLKEGIRESLRFRPNRLIVSEIRGDEATDFLQAINTGHRGGLTTIHANSTRDAITRIETLVLGTGWAVDPSYIRAQIASAINIVVQLSRHANGQRVVDSIQRITGIQQGVILMSDPIGIETTGIHQEKVKL